MGNALARGTVYMMLAQFIVLISGYLIHVFLGKLFGPEAYGNFGVILSLMLITKTLFLTGIVKSVTKYVSEQNERASSILRAGVKLQLILSFICVAFYLIFAEFLAQLFQNFSLAGPIRFSSLVVIPVGLYGIYSEGYLNGKRIFKKQALLEGGSSLLRVAIAVGLVYLGWGLYGAITAYVLAPLLAFFLILAFIERKEDSQKFELIKLVKYAIPITVFFTLLITTLDLGLLVIKSQLADPALAGFYTSASTIAKIIFSIFSALSLTMLPSISSAAAQNNDNLVKKYITQSLRYSLLILTPCAVIISVYSMQIIKLFYSSVYYPAAPALSILVWGMVLFSLFMLLCSFFQAVNKMNGIIFITGLVGGLALALNLIMVPKWGVQGGAIATTIAAFIGVFLISVITVKNFGAFIQFSSLLKIIFSGLVIYLLAQLWNPSGLLLAVAVILLGGLYLILLFFMKEITPEDVQVVKGTLRLN